MKNLKRCSVAVRHLTDTLILLQCTFCIVVSPDDGHGWRPQQSDGLPGGRHTLKPRTNGKFWKHYWHLQMQKLYFRTQKNL